MRPGFLPLPGRLATCIGKGISYIPLWCSDILWPGARHSCLLERNEIAFHKFLRWRAWDSPSCLTSVVRRNRCTQKSNKREFNEGALAKGQSNWGYISSRSFASEDADIITPMLGDWESHLCWEIGKAAALGRDCLAELWAGWGALRTCSGPAEMQFGNKCLDFLLLSFRNRSPVLMAAA